MSAQTKRALLVGISKYDKTATGWEMIHGTNDIALMSKALAGFETTKLLDSAATYANITKALKKLISQTKAGDIVYVHFSGHGQPYEDLEGDEADGWDEAFIPFDACNSYSKSNYEGKNHLTDDILHRYLEKLRLKAGKAGMVYVSIDACHSGDSYRGTETDDDEGILTDDSYIASLDLVSATSDNKTYERGSAAGFSPNNRIYLANHSQAKVYGNVETSPGMSKIVMLESCRSTEKSKELKLYMKDKSGNRKNFYCGLLSYSIYKVLKTSKLDSNADWVKSVKTVFDRTRQSDNKQQLVIEKTK